MDAKIFVEKVLLGAALKDRSFYKANINIFTEENFELPLHILILKSLKNSSDLALIDIELTGNTEYKNNKEYEYLKYLTEIDCTDREAYAKKLIELKVTKEIQSRYAKSLINITENKGYSQLIADHREVSGFQINIEQDVEKQEDAIDRLLENSILNYENNVEISGIRTGYSKIDKYLNGLQKQELLILAGRPGSAKSSLCLNMLDNIAVRYNSENVLFFSMEMSKDVVYKRMMLPYVGCSFNDLTNGRLTLTQFERYKYAAKAIKSNRYEIYDKPSITASEMRAKITQSINSGFKPAVVIADYVQIMGSDKKHSTSAGEVGYNAQALKDISKEFDVAMIAVSQLNRGVESREDKRPMLGDLKESGGLEQAGDSIIGLYREEYYTGNNVGTAELIGLKGRNIGTGTMFLGFSKEIMRFENIIY